MAMSTEGNYGQHATINVTPLIDVLLVLLIIFMVIVPTKSTGLNALVPLPPDSAVDPPTPRNDLVVSIGADGVIRLNQEVVALNDLGKRLRSIFFVATNHVLFLKGAKELEFYRVAEVIDIAKGAGLDRIALMTD